MKLQIKSQFIFHVNKKMLQKHTQFVAKREYPYIGLWLAKSAIYIKWQHKTRLGKSNIQDYDLL